MERRDFFKTSCALCLAAGTGMMLASLSSCAPLPVISANIEEDKIAVPVSSFEKSNLRIIYAQNSGFNVALRKEKDNTYTALLMRCTHADNDVVSTGSGFLCHQHGSMFDKEGAVTRGPAEIPMTKFKTNIIGDNIVIALR